MTNLLVLFCSLLATVVLVFFGVYLLLVVFNELYYWIVIGRKPLMSTEELSHGQKAKVKGVIEEPDEVLKPRMGDNDSVLYKYTANLVQSGESVNLTEVDEESGQVQFRVNTGSGRVLVPDSVIPSIRTKSDEFDNNVIVEQNSGVDPDNFEKSGRIGQNATVRERQVMFKPEDEVIIYGTAKKTSDRYSSWKITEGDATRKFVIGSGENAFDLDFVYLYYLVIGVMLCLSSLIPSYIGYLLLT